MGVSVENTEVVDRIDHLRKVPARIKFLCLEPLIGPLPNLNLDGIQWVITGGESGKNHRPIEEAWVRDIRDQCLANDIPFFFKQWGGKKPKSGGKELDGREYQEFPVDLSRYDKGGNTTPLRQVKQLAKLATTAKALIEKAESGCVDAYVKAGNKLIEAKSAVRKAGKKWGEWLEENGIPQRTASRAMKYAKDPDTYRKERVKDALTKREQRKQNGQMSGQKRTMLKIIQAATDSEIESICRLVFTDGSLVRLRDMLGEIPPQPDKLLRTG